MTLMRFKTKIRDSVKNAWNTTRNAVKTSGNSNMHEADAVNADYSSASNNVNAPHFQRSSFKVKSQ